MRLLDAAVLLGAALVSYAVVAFLVMPLIRPVPTSPS